MLRSTPNWLRSPVVNFKSPPWSIMYWCRFPGSGSGLVHALSSYTRLGQQACAEQFLASLTEFEHGIIREARVPVPVGRNAHSIWAAEQIVIMQNR